RDLWFNELLEGEQLDNEVTFNEEAVRFEDNADILEVRVVV
ncbi:unnamed protein product, partial [Didymodactylos carnosus]